MVAQMLDASALNADAEVKEVKTRGEALPKPERGNRKVSRGLNNDAAPLLKDSKFAEAIELLKRTNAADPAD